ncbi:unnamed protein product [Linum tenue]|uniref:Uncharacterized protein n=1 Tax=Linum tenue TaxID=586396 RepID=A0AAV0JAF0_9ROSI|nr:unnamed protein product [Linum tenue]
MAKKSFFEMKIDTASSYGSDLLASDFNELAAAAKKLAIHVGMVGEWLEMPAASILLIVVAPNLIASTLRNNFVGVAICLVIAGYLLQEHIRASGGFRNSFTKANGISNSVGIVLLFVYPAWALITNIL